MINILRTKRLRRAASISLTYVPQSVQRSHWAVADGIVISAIGLITIALPCSSERRDNPRDGWCGHRRCWCGTGRSWFEFLHRERREAHAAQGAHVSSAVIGLAFATVLRWPPCSLPRVVAERRCQDWSFVSDSLRFPPHVTFNQSWRCRPVRQCLQAIHCAEPIASKVVPRRPGHILPSFYRDRTGVRSSSHGQAGRLTMASAGRCFCEESRTTGHYQSLHSHT